MSEIFAGLSMGLSGLSIGYVLAWILIAKQDKRTIEKSKEELVKSIKTINEVHNSLTITVDEMQNRLSALEMMFRSKK